MQEKRENVGLVFKMSAFGFRRFPTGVGCNATKIRSFVFHFMCKICIYEYFSVQKMKKKDEESYKWCAIIGCRWMPFQYNSTSHLFLLRMLSAAKDFWVRFLFVFLAVKWPDSRCPPCEKYNLLQSCRFYLEYQNFEVIITMLILYYFVICRNWW